MTQTKPAQPHDIPATPLFAGLTEADWTEILPAATRLELAADEPVFLQGAPSTDLFVVVSGTVHVSVATPSGELAIAELGAGAVLGELSLLLGGAHSASVRTTAPTTLLRFSNDKFNSWLESASPAACRVLRNLANTLAARLLSADAHLIDLAKDQKGAPGSGRDDLEKLRGIFIPDWR